MIIGLSGKKQSGKDTVAKIIQYLTSGMINVPNWIWHSKPVEWAEMMTKEKPSYHKWQTKSFASKLKDIVCLLIGCTRKQLEDNEFKEKELGEEWRVHRTLYDEGFGPRVVKIFSTQMEATTEVYKIGMLAYQDSIILTPRLLLQLLGTEGGRNVIHPNIWVNSLMSDYRGTLNKPRDGLIRYADGWIIGNEWKKSKMIPNLTPLLIKPETNPEYFGVNYPNWIITDIRFPNEAKAIEDKGGIIIRIERNFFNRPVVELDNHPSETSLDDYKFKYTINNDGGIESLIEMVKTVLTHLKII